MQLGPYTLPNRFVLAPMAGVSQMPFRRIALELGAGFAPTELVSSDGLLRATARTLRYLRHDRTLERPFCVQIFGGDPIKMAEGAKVARDHGADLLDINMGCPVPKITRNGAGSALLCDPERAASLVEAVKRASGLPVSVKIRSGWDSTRQNAPEVARALEQGGACAIAIHPRTRAQGYTGLADWSMITRVKQAVKVPVVGNGDVKSKADAERMLLETGCDAVMIGRGALGNPWIFREVLGGAGPTPEERLAMVLRHLTEHIEFSGDTLNGVRSFRKTLLWYAHGLHGASAFRTIAARIDGFSEVREAIVRFFSEARADAPGGDGEQDIDLRAAYG